MDTDTGTAAETAETTSLGALRGALADLLDQEFAPSAGHVTAVLNTCLFAPSMLVFWLVNGVVDFSTAFVVGAVVSPGGLWVRLLAYVLLVPVFLALRAGYHLARPAHRRVVLSGSCPPTEVLSLDWFSVGILATGLPFALRDLGPWLGTNAVFLVGVFALPWLLPDRFGTPVKLSAIAGGSLLFLYASYGTVVGLDPGWLGPVATLELSASATGTLFRTFNSLLVGPAVVALFGLTMNRVLTRPELTSLPYLDRALPRRDPARVVVASAALGTAFYLGVAFVATGRLVLTP